MEILFDGSKELSRAFYETLQRAAALCVSREGLDPDDCEVSLSMVSAEEIRSLNRQFRGIDKETDVLSFPQYDGDEEWDIGEYRIPLGDVVICEDAARRQAAEYGHSFEREFVYLFVHSMLHLLGYDHMEEEEKQEMRAEEEAVMNALGITRETAGDGDSQVDSGKAVDYRELMERAIRVSSKAYAPYSRFFVGAALLAGSGEIYTGVNVENASFGATICAERSAVSAAVTAGEQEFRAIAVYSPSGPANPCGICRQVLAEFGQDMDVITGASEEEYEVTPLSSLLPKGFVL